MLRKFYLAIIFILTGSVEGFTQYDHYIVENREWFSGTVKRANGDVVEGLLNYNFITGLLSCKTQDESEPYSARNVEYFILKNDETAATKKFYSMPLKIEKSNNAEKMVFYEVLYESNRIALLSRHEYEYKEREASTPIVNGVGGVNGKWIIEKVIEKLYLADDQGNLIEYATKKKDKTRNLSPFYIDVSDTETNRNESITTVKEDLRYKIVDANAIQTVTGVDYFKVRGYINSKNLKLNTIRELIQLLEFYSSMNEEE